MHTSRKKTAFLAFCLSLALLCPTLAAADALYQCDDYAEPAIRRQADYGFPPAAYAWVAPGDLMTREHLTVLLVCLYEQVKQADLSDAPKLPEEDVLYGGDSPVAVEIRRRYVHKGINAGFAVPDGEGVFDASEPVRVDDLTEALSAFLSAMEGKKVSEAEALDHMETSANRHWGEIYNVDDSVFQTGISDLASGELPNRRVYAIVDDLIDAYGWEM